MWGPPLAARRYKDWTSQRAAQGGGPYKIKSANRTLLLREPFSLSY